MLLGSVCLLAGCIDRRSDEEMRGSIVYGFKDQLKTFDPTRMQYTQESAILMQVLQPLVRYNNDLELEPCLALSWSTPDNCMTWDFFLRPDVEFHDGTMFDAHAVKAHFDRTLDPRTAATRRARIAMIERTEVVDTLHVRFHLREPNCVLPEVITGTFASIPSPAAVARHGVDFGRNPVGTGPFVFEEWVPDVRVKLRRFERYWNAEAIHIERLEFWPVPEHTTRYILLEQGVLDMADIEFPHVNLARVSPHFELQSVPMLAIRYVGFNTQKAPFADVRLRRAANMALDRENLIRHVFFGVGAPAAGPIPPNHGFFYEGIRRYDFDAAAARQLVEEAGWPEGFTADFWTRESGEYRVLAEATEEALRQVGIPTAIRPFDNAQYWTKFDAYIARDGRREPTKEGVFDLYIGGWAGGETAHGFLESLFMSGNYSNSAFYHNPEVDELLLAAKREVNDDRRRAIYNRIQEIVVDDSPWLFAYHPQLNIGVRSRVKGFRINPSNWLFFEGVTVADDGAAGTVASAPGVTTP